MPTILFAARSNRWKQFGMPLRSALDQLNIDCELVRNASPATVDYIIYAPNSDLQDFTPFTSCKAVLSLWAGVESIASNQTLTQPLVRMVDHGLTRGMTEWVTGHVLRHHLGMDVHIHGQDGVWRNGVVPPLAEDRKVTILGLGALGSDAALALSQLGFDVAGWSRSAKEITGIKTFSGKHGLEQALDRAEILVLLLPLTHTTQHILNAGAIARLPRGAVIINPGRGPLVDDASLLAALDRGHIAHATLDVFETEPLPSHHPYWAHPQVTVTPHIASETRAASAARVIAENIRRGEAGEPFLHLVDRKLGY